MTVLSCNAIPVPGRHHFFPAEGYGGKRQSQSLNLPMFQYIILVFSESLATLAVTCLGFGVLVYFTLHNWEKFAALSRNRSQLLSVGVGVAVVLLVLQLRQSRGGVGAPESGGDFFAGPIPHRVRQA